MKNRIKQIYFKIALVLLGFLTLSGCDLFDLLVNSGEQPPKTSIKITIPYPSKYIIEKAGYKITNNSTYETISGDLIVDNDNSMASLELFVPAGKYSVSGNLYKNWDNETGSCFDVSTLAKPVTLEEGKASTLELDDPLSTNVATLEIEADVTSLVTALSALSERTVDFVGVWLNNTDPNVNDNYHFHTEAALAVEPQIFRGVYNYVKPGSYDIELVAANFGHPDWNNDEPWHRDITAVNMQQPFTVAAGTTVNKYSSYLIYQIGTDFGTDFDNSPFFLEQWEGGVSETVGGELHLKANGADGVGGCGLNGFSFGNQSITTFNVMLGARANGDHPMLHVNFMQSESDNDTRLMLLINEDQVFFSSNVNGETAGLGSDVYNLPSTFNDSNYHNIKVFIRNGIAYLYINGGNHPVISYEFDERIPNKGSFNFECHQEVYIDDLSISNNVLGNLALK